MPTNKKRPCRTDDLILEDQNLLRELGELSEILYQRLSSAPEEHPDSSGETMLLVRPVSGLTQETWHGLARKHSLCAWALLPLRPTSAEAVRVLADAMDNLVFQRDHDLLTGLANRRYFEYQLKLELARAMRTKTPLSLIMLDLDHFKKVNDLYGHLYGDKVLQKFGSFLRKSQRAYDFAARYGGEEFILLMPGLTCWKAKIAAERLLHQFSKIQFTQEGLPPFNMTFSGGVSGVNMESGYSIPPDQLIKIADEALYAAKQQGRSRVNLTESCVARVPVASSMVRPEEKQLLFQN
ncbi:MAG: GGDEF domain-containing protein [Deltaproteobacteria bacterium]|jgi:diguanylate cyclase (GGDEF)-like protein|nr:GGDEF domain-containing protein [Deltaproteobacteria bacterium]